MYKLHTQCRACGDHRVIAEGIKAIRPASTLVPVLDLGPMPLANDFRKEGEERAGYAPLKVMYCERCGLAQLNTVVDPKLLYTNYSYVTLGESTMMKQHFEMLKRDFMAEQGSKRLGNVLEIGSNNGALLNNLKECASKVFGIDPAENLVKLAVEAGVPSVAMAWSHLSAAYGKAMLGDVAPDIIIFRHVFCHIDDWQTAINAVEGISGGNTLIYIEAPWVMDMLDKGEWDTIYHEHLSYLSLGAIQALLKPTGLMLCAARHYPVHGGTMGLFLRRKDSGKPVQDSVDTYLATEFSRIGLGTWDRFESKAWNLIHDLRLLVNKLNEDGKKVVGYGASAKSTNWVSACGFSKKQLAFITDTTFQKWYTTSPGTDIPITDSGAHIREQSDYAIMFCWNFEREVLKREMPWLERGGKFIIPLPEVQIVGAEEALARI